MANTPDDTELKLELYFAKRVHAKNVLLFSIVCLLLLVLVAGYILAVVSVARSGMDGDDKSGIIAAITIASVITLIGLAAGITNYMEESFSIVVNGQSRKVSKLLKGKIERDRAQLKITRYWNDYGDSITRSGH